MSFNKLNANERLAKRQLTNLYPVYPYAVDEICNQTTKIGGKLFRDALIYMAENNENHKKAILLFVQNVNSKLVRANDKHYFNYFTKLWKESQEEIIEQDE